MGLAHLRQDEVLLDGQAADDAPVLGHELDAGLGRLVRLQRVQRLAGEPDLAALHRRRFGARDGAERRGLAGAIAAEQSEDLALPHVERNALHDVALAVIGVEVAAGEIGRRGQRQRSLAAGAGWPFRATAAMPRSFVGASEIGFLHLGIAAHLVRASRRR